MKNRVHLDALGKFHQCSAGLPQKVVMRSNISHAKIHGERKIKVHRTRYIVYSSPQASPRVLQMRVHSTVQHECGARDCVWYIVPRTSTRYEVLCTCVQDCVHVRICRTQIHSTCRRYHQIYIYTYVRTCTNYYTYKYEVLVLRIYIYVLCITPHTLTSYKYIPRTRYVLCIRTSYLYKVLRTRTHTRAQHTQVPHAHTRLTSDLRHVRYWIYLSYLDRYLQLWL